MRLLEFINHPFNFIQLPIKRRKRMYTRIFLSGKILPEIGDLDLQTLRKIPHEVL